MSFPREPRDQQRGRAWFCPYVGLEPYAEAQSEYFFGRERERRIISSNLYATSLTVLYGASGTGKSSVLMAGVVPHLRLQPRTTVVVFREWQTASFLDALKTECLKAFETAQTEHSLESSLPLDELLGAISRELRSTVLIILDQFEEYFLYHPLEDNTFEAEFARSVNRADGVAHFLVALREDQLSRLDRFRLRIPNVLGNTLSLKQLDLGAAEDAIRKPIVVYNARFETDDSPITIEDDLVARLLADENMRTGHVLFDELTGSGRTNVQQESPRIETPLMQLVMTRLWDEEHDVRAREKESAGKNWVKRPLMLRFATLSRLGGVRRIVRTHLDDTMTTRLTDFERELSARMFQFLVTPHGAKIAHSTEDLIAFSETGSPEVVRRLLETMETARILRRHFPPERYEIFHDVLAPAILDWRARFVQAQLELKTALGTVEYIVVGSGAGGGTVAARLAEAGRRVLLLEAGGDPHLTIAPRLPEGYDVPAFHAFASENDAMEWDFFVRHYSDEGLQASDWKYVREIDGRKVDGILYPRASVLGGCTSNDPMILMYPTNREWDELAKLTGDSSWAADDMRKYSDRLAGSPESTMFGWLEKLIQPGPASKGWLTTETSLAAVEGDATLRGLLTVLIEAAATTLGEREYRGRRSERASNLFKRLRLMFRRDSKIQQADSAKLLRVLLHARTGSRERVQDVVRRCPERLRVELNALATRVLFDENNRAIGVEYLKGERLYGAHSDVNRDPGELRQAFASREVILCGGAFNTPQLLMLSGIGSEPDLRRQGIPVRVDLPGVGGNLQDRYEISVVNRLEDPRYWSSPDSAVFDERGNRYVFGITQRSTPDRVEPDLCLLALFGRFAGYYPSYSEAFPRSASLTWVIAKAHTLSLRGQVTLRSANPRDTPRVNFNYFGERTDSSVEDLDPMVEGIRFARKMTHVLKARGIMVEEEAPGDVIASNEALRRFIRSNAWGQHASCSCPIGDASAGGVLGSDFRVHGTKGLRVVDASVFPRLPGFFIASAVYMIGEKAADVILADETRRPKETSPSP